MLTSPPTAVQVPGPITIANVDDDRGFRFTVGITRTAPTVADPTPDWSVTVTIIVNPTTPPTNARHRRTLLQNATFLLLGDLIPDVIALNNYLQSPTGLYNDLANLLMPPNV